MSTEAKTEMTPDEMLAALLAMYRPDPAQGAASVAARVRRGDGRWHTGYLTADHPSRNCLRIRDSRRAPRSQYALVSPRNVASVELQQPNGRYLPAFPQS